LITDSCGPTSDPALTTIQRNSTKGDANGALLACSQACAQCQTLHTTHWQRFETSSLIATILLARPSVSEDLPDDVSTSLKTKGFITNAKANATAGGAGGGSATRGSGTIRLLLDHAREALRCAKVRTLET